MEPNQLNPFNLGKLQSQNQNQGPGHNLLDKSSPERSVRQKVFYILPMFEVLGIALAFGTAWYYRAYLGGAGTLVTPLIVASCLGIVATTSFFLTKNLSRRAITVLLETVALASLFVNYRGISIPYLVFAGVVMLGVRLYGEWRGRNELQNGMEIKYFRTVKPVLGKFITAGVLFAILIYMPQWDPKKEVISQSYFDQIFGASMNLVNKIYPQFNASSTLTGVANDMAQKQLAEQPLWSALTSDAQANQLARATEEILKNLEAKLSFTVSPQEKLSAIAYRFMTNTVAEWSVKAGQGFFIGFGILLFFIFRGFGAILYIPLAMLSFLAYQTLLAGNIIHIAGESQLKEVIEYS